MPRVRGLAVLSSLLLLRVSAAAAAPVIRASADLEVAGGHDDNMLLATAPDAPTSLDRLGGWFGQAAPLLSLGLGGAGMRLEASYAGDYRFADQVGHLYYQEGELTGFFPPLGPARLHLGLSGGRFDASRFPEDRFLFAGGEAGLRLGLLDWLRLLGRYRGQWRRLGNGTVSTDLLHAGDLRVLVIPSSALEIGPRGSLLIVEPSSADGIRFTRWRAGLDASWALGPLTAAAGTWLGGLHLGELRERHLGGHAELRMAVSGALDIFANAELAEPISSDASRDYARRMFSLGLAVRATLATRAAAPPPELDLRPLVQGARVRLRLEAAPGAQVSVLGSWDDWQAPGQRLTLAGPSGVFEAWLTLPAGSHRYHFVVDGQARRPPDAPRYAPDGFGGEDGVLDVGLDAQ